jgi:hypothetical protein
VGGAHHPNRKSALELVRVADTLGAVIEDIGRIEGTLPKTVVTSARQREESVSFAGLRAMIEKDTPVLLVLGTAWGLAEEVMQQADHTLVPISSRTGYNHLSVRSAASIMLDRLLGNDRE